MIRPDDLTLHLGYVPPHLPFTTLAVQGHSQDDNLKSDEVRRSFDSNGKRGREFDAVRYLILCSGRRRWPTNGSFATASHALLRPQRFDRERRRWRNRLRAREYIVEGGVVKSESG